MIVTGTGHRPDKLGGYDLISLNKLVAIASDWLDINRPTKVISGVALGWDTALACATINKRIPLICAVPFKGQERLWSDYYKELYRLILAGAESVEYICEGEYTPRKMQIRNEWMVDKCDLILAMWDGTMGGTYNCLKYAENKQKTIINLYDKYEQTLIHP